MGAGLTVKAAEAGGVAAAAALGRLRVRHRVAPELLAQQRQRGELLPILGLAHRPRQVQLHRQLVAVAENLRGSEEAAALGLASTRNYAWTDSALADLWSGRVSRESLCLWKWF